MTTVLKDGGGGDYELPSEGVHLAICDQVVDLGIQPSQRFDPARKLWLRFQLPNEQTTWKDKDGNEHTGPLTCGRIFTQSLGEKSHLRPFLEAWRNRKFTKEELDGFEAKNVLGKPLQVQILHVTRNNKTRADVTAAMALPKGTVVPAPYGELLYYDHDKPDQAVLEKLGKGIQRMIGEAIDGAEAIRVMARTVSPAARGKDEDFEDDIPF